MTRSFPAQESVSSSDVGPEGIPGQFRPSPESCLLLYPVEVGSDRTDADEELLANVDVYKRQIFDSSGSTIEELLTSGLSEAEQARIGHRPTGEGLLGLHLSDPRPLRLIHLDEHPMSTGLPAHHPPMDSMLSVPVSYTHL